MKRRYFNKTIITSLAGFSVPQNLTSKGNNSKKLGIALVGLGNYSKNQLAPALEKTEFCELKGIVTGTPSKAKTWQAKYNLSKKNIYNYENLYKKR